MTDDIIFDKATLVPALEGVMWSLAPVAIVIVSLRFYARIRIIHHVGWDDWLMLLSIVLMLKNSAFVQVSIHYGLGRHIGTLEKSRAQKAIMWDYLAQPSAIMAPTFGRISFVLTIMTLIGNSRTRRSILWFILVTQMLVNVLCFSMILAQCKPVALLWDKSLEGECWDLRAQEYFGYFQGAYNSATDLVLAIWPAYVFWHLNMKRSMKISISLLMGIGVFAMVGSIVKTIYLSSVGSADDYTFNTAYLVIWWSVENYAVIIAASIPMLRPLVARNRSVNSAYPSAKSSWMNLSSDRRGKPRRGQDIDGMPLTVMRPSLDGNTSHKHFGSAMPTGDGSIMKTSEVTVKFGQNRERMI
ncbi:unnamed protein product [Periconia digitata]|uniref:Rhodopsin domain-containing protein n=1 Tax=Periconia digitata TaxID=1303443 RepID=A0A9W4XEN2_9PLEO|nr:unnamed protein product [Periconia digitata]